MQTSVIKSIWTF